MGCEWPIAQFDPRPYQVEAFERMVARSNQLLALVMGSGKTLTVQAAVEHLWEGFRWPLKGRG